MYAKADQVADVANEAKKHAAKAAIRYLIYNTPVDESTALSNWVASLGGGLTVFPLPAYVLGKAGSTKGASAGEAWEAAVATIALAKPGEPIYLSNVVPYIGELNRGSSSQHPGGFDRIAVNVGKASLRGFRYNWNR